MIQQAILLFIFAILLINIYFLVARKTNIVDVPNNRSSHSGVIIRGGGILFPVFAALFVFLNGIQYAFFLCGLLLISTVSFWDDIKNISYKLRFLIHLVSVLLIIYELDIYSYWWVLLVIPATIGFINAYNFMDGINGITGVYSLITIAGLYVVNSYFVEFEQAEMFVFLLVPIGAFLVYNFRIKAKCFAGDVGAVSMAYILLFLMIKLIIATGNFIFVLFVAVYGIDVVFTIIQRLWLGQNIFEAHRMHLYQLLANDKKWPHLGVSILYSLIQVIINLIVLSIYKESPVFQWGIGVVVVVVFSALYIVIKQKILSSSLKRLEC